ncbi:mucin-binding protein, partial [Limosilactobacillus reuteri]
VAKLYRDATYDDVTGEVIYGAWSTDSTHWATFTPDAIPGYTVKPVPAVEVKNGQKNVTVNVAYIANDQSTHIIYQDAKGNTVRTDTVSGKTDQTVDTNSSLPTGWKIAETSKVKTIPSTITFKGV